VGKRFIFTLVKILDGVKARKWNSEQCIVYSLIILQHGDATIKSANAIKERITSRMDTWDKINVKMLVQGTLRYMEARLLKRKDRQSPEQRARVFQMKMLKGDLRGAVKHLTETEKGGALMPDQIDDKTGLAVKEVLQLKHLTAMTPHHSTVHPYDEVPAFPDIDISHDTIEQVACRLSGSVGLVGVDSQAVSHWCFAYGNASDTMQHSLSSSSMWIGNYLPPWDPY
jgi:hypothetical protein